ncbi:MAG: hypothetical protein JWR16_346 [Nevskia sp.]|nr:hypothetical protein [Nevskia sp.]
MSRSYVAALLGVALTLPGLASANDLLDYYRVAQQQDMTLQAALYQRDAAIEAKPQALSYLMPQLTASGTYERDREHDLTGSSLSSIGGSTGGTTAGTTGGTVIVNSNTSYFTTKSYALTLSQALFDWSAFQTVAQASRQVAQAEATYRSAEQALLFRVADAYFNVLFAQDTLQADLDARNSFQQQFQQAQKKFEVGLAAITDVRNAQASLDTASATVIADQRALDSAKRSLGQIVGKPVVQIAGLQDDIPLAAPDPLSEDQWVSAALQDNPDLMTSYETAEAARKNIDVFRGQYLPTLSLQGSVGRKISDFAIESDTIDDAIGLQLNWNIFQGGLVASQVRQAKATYLQTQAQYQGERRVVDQGARDAYEQVISGIASVKANKQAVISNQTSLEASKVGLRVGTRTEVDVLTAQQALATAQRLYYQARYDYLRGVLSLKQQAGRLIENDLAGLDQLLQAVALPSPQITPLATPAPTP